MDQFTYYAPTEILFGRDTENQAGAEVKKRGGSRVVIVYGSGSVLRSGLLKRVEKSLEAENIEYISLGGVVGNPRVSLAREMVEKAVEFRADFILAVGGGSAIDTAKGVAHGAANPGTDLWDIWTKKVPLTKSLPVASVLTLSATGSEMSDSAVLTNEETREKKGLSTVFNRCIFSILNPELTFTVPDYPYACGICDIMMHTMERYFIPGPSARLTDEIAEGLLRTVIDNGRIGWKNRTDYDAMAEVMWASSLSHNDLTQCGRGKDFSVHKFGQALGGKYDTAHGATLTAVWGAWAEYLYPHCPSRFAQYARKVWGVDEKDDLAASKEGVRRTVAFFKELKMPVNIRETGVNPTKADLDELADTATVHDTVRLTRILPVGRKEAREIFEAAVDYDI